jgi:hypothetical protein
MRDASNPAGKPIQQENNPAGEQSSRKANPAGKPVQRESQIQALLPNLQLTCF